MMPELIIIGAGGHAKVVVATARAAGWTQIRLVDVDERRWGTTMLGVSISGDQEAVLADVNAHAVLAIGSNRTRALVAARARCQLVTLCHPAAYLDSTVKVSPGSVLFAGVVVQADASIGASVILNTGVTVDHDCEIEDAVHLAPGVHLAGNVRVREGAFVGIGACAVPGVSIGAWSTVGAGGVVVRDVPPAVVVVGVPARERSHPA